jgi:Fe2+ or Zn2+ uptake regulation protein
MRTVLTLGAAVTNTDRIAYGSARVTRQRRSIARAAREIGTAFTVDELVEVVREIDPKAGATATVYRAVAAMESAGFVQRVGSRDGAALYVRCSGTPHHHHVICDRCGRIAKTDCPFGPELGASNGFVITRHEVTLYGLCPTCAPEGHA